MLRIGELIRDLMPAGVINVITGGDALGPLMTAHRSFEKVSFTGSTATGRRVMESAAPTLKRLTLELGGNDAAIVMPDVNVPETVEKLFWSAFTNSGQVCVATKRAYVHNDIYDAFRDELAKLAKAVPMGDGSEQGTALGPIQNKPQYDRVRGLLADCEANGYRLLQGDAPEGDGFFVPVTLVDNPPEDSRIVHEEQFGPILPLVRFTDVQDAIEKANNTDMGLAGTVWSADTDAAMRVAERMDVFLWQAELRRIDPFFSRRHVPDRRNECGKLGVGHFMRIDPETSDPSEMRWAFLRAHKIRPHHEFTSCNVNRVRSDFGTIAKQRGGRVSGNSILAGCQQQARLQHESAQYAA